MSIEENKTLILHFWDELNKGNLSIVDEYFTNSFIRYAADGQDMDRDGYKNLVTTLSNNFPDIHYVVDDIVAEGDRVAFRFTWTATNQSDMMDSALKGKRFTITEDYFCRIKDGKIMEFRNLLDRLSWFEQAGITPPVVDNKK